MVSKTSGDRYHNVTTCQNEHRHLSKLAKVPSKERFTYHRSEHHVHVVDASQSEIGQLDLTGRRDQHVLRLQVSVNDAIGVQEIHPAKNLIHQILHTHIASNY